MPTHIVPTTLNSATGNLARHIIAVHRLLGHHLRFSYSYPRGLGLDGQRPTATPADSVEIHQVEQLTKVDEALQHLGPEWTIIANMWYNRWADVRPYAVTAGRHSPNVVVGCTGTSIVPELPPEVIIGYDNLHQRQSKEPQLPVEQLVGRKVCIIGGMPRRQFTTFCELTLQGVDVVGVVWPVSWLYNALKTKVYYDVHLDRQPGHHLSVETCLLEGTKNSLAWWTLGLARVNRFLTTGQPGDQG